MTSRPVLIAGRCLLWAAVVLVLGRGLVSLFAGPVASGAAPKTAVVVGERYPTAEAQGFAARFTADYLTYDDTRPADWQARTATYGTGALGSGWDGKGHQTVTTVVPTGVETISATYGVVTVAAQTTSGWVHLAVPVASTTTGLAIAARPAFVAAPPAGHAPDLNPSSDPDAAAAEEVRPTVEAFLGAYATGQAAVVKAMSADGARLPELDGGRFTLAGVDTVTVPKTVPEGPARTAVVTLRWADSRSGASLAQTYRIGLARVGERWLVTSVGPVRPESNPNNPVKEKP